MEMKAYSCLRIKSRQRIQICAPIRADLSKPVNIKIVWQNVFFLKLITKTNKQTKVIVDLCTEFHLKQSTLKLRDQICFKKVFWGQNLRKQSSNSESAPLCTEFHLKQSSLLFLDQICPKKIFLGQNLWEPMSN